ncbi:MAG: STAS domain-containing protein [Pseudonocardiales bacterium]|nr:STAS domain-containing protein [Pseudonocardiales bacterium]
MASDRLPQPDRCSTPDDLRRGVDGTALFTVIVHQLNPADVILHIAGEIDLISEPSLQAHVSTLLASQPERLIIDLSQVSFMGATGLSMLIKTRGSAAQQGTALKLRNPSRFAVRPLEITGLDRLFDVLPSATE